MHGRSGRAEGKGTSEGQQTEELEGEEREQRGKRGDISSQYTGAPPNHKVEAWPFNVDGRCGS